LSARELHKGPRSWSRERRRGDFAGRHGGPEIVRRKRREPLQRKGEKNEGLPGGGGEGGAKDVVEARKISVDVGDISIRRPLEERETFFA